MNKSQISALLRKTGLLFHMDWLRFRFEKARNFKKNREFQKRNPSVVLPPDYLIYESFRMDYEKYYDQGRSSTKWLVEHLQRHYEITHNSRILDWGCGPARILRHMPEITGRKATFFGTDYNKESIDWCSKNIPNINFSRNNLEARLQYEDDYMDIIYGISIFTHLSEQLHFDWYNELHRVLKPGGIMFLTTQGDNFKVKLLESELAKFNKGELVVRGNVKEGHRTFSAFHPKEFMRKMFKDVKILEHIEPLVERSSIPQDIWIIRKQVNIVQ